MLEQRRVTPLGSNDSVDLDIRVLAATNISREDLMNEQKFRQDLLFRLNTVEITLPPLRERSEDITEIAVYYAKLYARKYNKPEKLFSKEALMAAKNIQWQGNVRALRHAIERAVILSEGHEFSAQDLQLLPAVNTQTLVPILNQSTGADKAEIADLNLVRMEKMYVETALKRHQYNISKAAKALGLTRTALYRRMEKHGF